MLDTVFRLTLNKALLIAGVWVLCVVLHNVVYALFRDWFGADGDEPFFFLLAVVVIPLYVIAALAYTAVRRFR